MRNSAPGHHSIIIKPFKKHLCLSFSLILLCCCCSLKAADSGDAGIIALHQNRGLLISRDGGRSWTDFNQGLPTGFIPLRIKADSRGYLYLLTRHSGLFRYTQKTGRWESLNCPDFLERFKRSDRRHYRKISAFDINPDNPDMITLATKHSLYITRTGGANWEKLSLNGLNSRNYITALSLSGREGRLMAGSAFNGIFLRNGRRFVKKNRGLPRETYTEGYYFYEEVGDLYQRRGPSREVFCGLNFSGAVLHSRSGGDSWQDLSFPHKNPQRCLIHDLQADGQRILVSSSEGIYEYHFRDRKWTASSLQEILKRLPEDEDRLALFIQGKDIPQGGLHFSFRRHHPSKNAETMKQAGGRQALYASVFAVRKNLKGLIKSLKECGLNALVIDMKDDFGQLFYPTSLKTAKDIGAAKKPLDVKGILKTLRQEGIYTIARVVVFKDGKLFRGYKGKYAILNRRTKVPWRGTEHEFWVDPHSDFVQQYNVDIARELESLGFDEIQFDYIRFPSDGPIHLCHFRYREDPETYKSEVLINFLQKAKESLRIPVSVDIYGFNSWYHFGNWIGQDMDEFADIVDAISPMVYPSHFGNRFYKRIPSAHRPYSIVLDGGYRAHRMTGKSVHIRPYLQAFNLLSPSWSPEYIRIQIEASEKSGCSGYIFWNANGDYKMVRRACKKK